jgi:hypothetical protein
VVNGSDIQFLKDILIRLEEKVDRINQHGCAKRNGDLLLIEETRRMVRYNYWWIRGGIVSLLGLLILQVRKWLGI